MLFFYTGETTDKHKIPSKEYNKLNALFREKCCVIFTKTFDRVATTDHCGAGKFEYNAVAHGSQKKKTTREDAVTFSNSYH